MALESDSDYSSTSYDDDDSVEERGSFMSVVEIERVRRDPFAGMKISDWYQKKRESTKRRGGGSQGSGNGSHKRHSKKRQSTRRRRKKGKAVARAGAELSVREDMVPVIAVVSLALLSAYHMVNSMTPHQISVVLGYGLVALGATSKLPYVRSLERSKTAVGISAFKQYSDIISISFTILFNVNRRYPFLAWGEKAFILAQDLYVTSLVWKFNKVDTMTQAFWSAAYSFALVSMFYGIRIVDAEYRWVIPLIKLVSVSYRFVDSSP